MGRGQFETALRALSSLFLITFVSILRETNKVISIQMFDATRAVKRLAAMIGAILVWTGDSAIAKPLLTNSQSTYVSACLEQDDTPERLVEICQLGLGTAGASDRQRIDMLDRLAWAYFDLDNFDASERAFSEILELNPEAEPGLQGKAWILYYRDDYGPATEMFRKAVSRKPTAGNLAGLAASALYGGESDIEEFEGRMRAALALDPEYSWAIRQLAWELSDNGRSDEALELFRSAIEIDPLDSYAEYGMAYVLSDQNQWEPAFEHITRTLELHPEFVSALSRRSLILLMLDRPKQALKDAEAVIAAKPENADGYVRKARALSELGLRSEAHSVLEAAESQVGSSNYLVFWRARLLVDDHNYDEALIHIRRSIKLDGADYIDHRLHAEVALWLDDLREARGAIDQALSLNPDAPYVQYVDALVLSREGDFEAAEDRFDNAIKAGLSRGYLSDFLSVLVGEGRFIQAIKLRVRYNS